MTIGRKGPIGMAPGDEVTVTYDLVAPDPSPQNERVDAPIRSEFSLRALRARLRARRGVCPVDSCRAQPP